MRDRDDHIGRGASAARQDGPGARPRKAAWLGWIVAVVAIGGMACGSCSDDGDEAGTSSDAPAAAADADATPAGDAPPADVIHCGTDSAAALAACAEAARIRADVEAMAGPRTAGAPKWQAAQDLCASRFEAAGFTVERQRAGQAVNVIGRKAGTSLPDELVYLGAHYDSIPNCDGADDNASGVAGLLEAARILGPVDHDRTLVLACWDAEELGLVGSRNHVVLAARSQPKVQAHFNFEMIAYTSDEPESQQFPGIFTALFPEVAAELAANQNRGDFIALLGDPRSAEPIAAMVRHGQAAGLKTAAVELTDEMTTSSNFGDFRRSDHAPFWDLGLPGIFITDTANFRYPGYHCSPEPDDVEGLDFDFARGVTAAVIGAAAEMLDGDQAFVGSAPPAPACSPVAQDCAGGQKCAFQFSDGRFVASCVAPPAAPAATGEPCTRPNDVPGEDDCVAGDYCTFWGLPRGEPQARRCRRHCVSDDDCPPGEGCALIHTSGYDAGVCSPRCALLAGTCPDDTQCLLRATEIDDLSRFPFCGFLGASAEGASCTLFGDGECVAGFMCEEVDERGRICHRPCDAANPCPNDRACIRMPDGSGPDGFGTCAP